MRLNAVPPSSVTAPEVRGEVGGVAAARAISPQGSGASLAASQGPAEAAAPAPERASPIERRRVERRGDERRKQKLPVLLDMRGRPRRKTRRRASDETPPSIDTKA